MCEASLLYEFNSGKMANLDKPFVLCAFPVLLFVCLSGTMADILCILIIIFNKRTDMQLFPSRIFFPASKYQDCVYFTMTIRLEFKIQNDTRN